MSTPEPHQIVCMKWGDRYGAEYVNRLYKMLADQCRGPFRLVCQTDDASGVRPEVECVDCPAIDIPAPQCLAGWRKVTLWKEQVPGLESGRDALFIDLDTVLTGPVDDFFTYQPSPEAFGPAARGGSSFVVIKNWPQPDKRIGNTSLYRFRVGEQPHIYETLMSRTAETLGRFPNSQSYISATAHDMAFWPEEWCRSFKVHCVPKGVRRYYQEPAVPEGARVIAFPGRPDPGDAVLGKWPAPPHKRIYKHIRPATWIADAWGETA